jgi:hypothetical protein
MRRAMSRTEVARVIRIDPVGDRRDSVADRKLLHAPEEFVLAVIASVGIIRDVERVLGLVRCKPFVPDAVIVNEGFCDISIMLRIARRKRGDGEGVIAQRARADPCQIS